MQQLKNRPFLDRLKFALAGIRHAVRTERSLATQVSIFALVLIALVILQPPLIWFAIVIIASAAVIAAELFNTAVERLADRLHPDQHPEIQIVKDCAAGAVLVISLGAVVIACLFVFELWSRR